MKIYHDNNNIPTTLLKKINKHKYIYYVETYPIKNLLR